MCSITRITPNPAHGSKKKGEVLNILFALPQRWNAQANATKPVVEVSPETALLDLTVKFNACCRNHSPQWGCGIGKGPSRKAIAVQPVEQAPLEAQWQLLNTIQQQRFAPATGLAPRSNGATRQAPERRRMQLLS